MRWVGRLPPSRVLGEKEWEGGKCHSWRSPEPNVHKHQDSALLFHSQTKESLSPKSHYSAQTSAINIPCITIYNCNKSVKKTSVAYIIVRTFSSSLRSRVSVFWSRNLRRSRAWSTSSAGVRGFGLKSPFMAVSYNILQKSSFYFYYYYGCRSFFR